MSAAVAPAVPVDWRRNLAALWFAEFTAIFGFSFAFPFLPVFLHVDLGVTNPHSLALWSGLAGGASGAGLAVASPVWGAVADRYGRRPMLIRAMIGGGFTVGLMSLAQSPLQLVVLRLIQGATSGTIAACNALVATETPRERVGWALGVLTSSVALGGAFGPLVGGLAGAAFGLRALFAAGGVLLLLATIPVFAFVRETPRAMTAAQRPSALSALRAQRPGTVRAVAMLLLSMTLYYTFFGATQQLAVLRLVDLLRGGATAITGLAFGAFGLSQSIAAVLYSRVTIRTGYRRLAASVSAASTLALLGDGALADRGAGRPLPGRARPADRQPRPFPLEHARPGVAAWRPGPRLRHRGQRDSARLRLRAALRRRARRGLRRADRDRRRGRPLRYPRGRARRGRARAGAMTRLAPLILVLGLAACGQSTGSSNLPPAAAGSPTPTGSPSADACNNAFKTQMEKQTTPPAMSIDTGKTFTATIKTPRGDIVVRLDPKAAPETVNNFVYLSRNGFYNCLRFHRVEPGFVIQGGDPLANGTGGPGYMLPNETNPAAWLRGSLGMASSQAGVNGSQFFILTGDATYLSQSGVYNHFGTVTSGLDVADKIQPQDEIQEIDIAQG